MKIRFFGFEIELRKETEEECRERVAREFRKKWGIPEKPEKEAQRIVGLADLQRWDG